MQRQHACHRCHSSTITKPVSLPSTMHERPPRKTPEIFPSERSDGRHGPMDSRAGFPRGTVPGATRFCLHGVPARPTCGPRARAMERAQARDFRPGSVQVCPSTYVFFFFIYTSKFARALQRRKTYQISMKNNEKNNTYLFQIYSLSIAWFYAYLSGTCLHPSPSDAGCCTPHRTRHASPPHHRRPCTMCRRRPPGRPTHLPFVATPKVGRHRRPPRQPRVRWTPLRRPQLLACRSFQCRPEPQDRRPALGSGPALQWRR